MTVTNEDRERMLGALDQGQESETFRFDRPGDVVVGRMLRLEHSDMYDCKILILDTDEEKPRAIWCFHTALLGKLQRVRPRPGDLVAIRRESDVKGSNGRTYRNYTVKSSRAAETADWGVADAADPTTADLGDDLPPVQRAARPAADPGEGFDDPPF